MDKVLLNDFSRRSHMIGIELTEKQLHQFDIFYDLLIETNKVMNLTAITDPRDVMEKHFLDSLFLKSAFFPKKNDKLIDIGTGAGFPGIPLKIAFPDTEVVLADSLSKRVSFLSEVIERCHLSGISAVHGRAEDLARDLSFREQFDICVSRAVASLPVLCEYALPFVKKGGCFIAYKSMNIDHELKESEYAISCLGGSDVKIIPYNIPETGIGHCLIQIDKHRNTSSRYPRRAGTPMKKPLVK